MMRIASRPTHLHVEQDVCLHLFQERILTHWMSPTATTWTVVRRERLREWSCSVPPEVEITLVVL
jgi:hypothetical protein